MTLQYDQRHALASRMTSSRFLLIIALGAFPLTPTIFADSFDVGVSNTSDDAEEDNGGDVTLDSRKIELGQMNWCGFRFDNVTIPPGATVSSAYVRFRSRGNNSESTDLTIFGHAADNSPSFMQSTDDISNRSRTSISVSWANVENWSNNSFFNTPDITPVIQEVVSRPGWSSGNSLSILIRSDDLNGERLVWSRDQNATHAPRLYVEYSAAAPALFVDVSSDANFDVQTTSSDDYGAGWHWADVDSDGDLDAIVGGNSARLLTNNSGNDFFVSSLGDVRRQGGWIDLDDDGDVDFWAANINNYDVEGCFVNNGSGGFNNDGDFGASNPTNNEGVAVGDFDRDGLADIAMFSADRNWLLFNQGGDPVTLSATDDVFYGLNDAGDYGNGDFCASADVNNDGVLDFFYHYNGGKLFLSNGDETWTENNAGISVHTGNEDKIGSNWADYDNDGDLDLFVPRYDDGQRGYLWRNDSGVFTDVTVAAGISDTQTQRSCSWGDYDNDGNLDLYITTYDASHTNILYQSNGDGTFTAVNVGASITGEAHDGVFVDYDNDGDLDLVVAREGDTNVLLQNQTDDDAYVKVRLVGRGAGGTNQLAIGTRVELYEADGTTLIGRRDVGVARGYGGSEPLWLHFGGVDPDDTYVIRAHFVTGMQEVTFQPSAVSTTIGATTIDQMLTITEPPGQEQTKIVNWQEVEPD